MLFVRKLDRLRCNSTHVVWAAQELLDLGVGRGCSRGGAQIDTTVADGRLGFGVFVVLAELEREPSVAGLTLATRSLSRRPRNGGRG